MYHIHILHGETELETINVRLVSSCCSEGAISIGAVCAAELTVKVSGSLALTDEIITAAVQQDGEAETPLGTFRVTTCQQNSGTTTITAYDAAYYALGGEYTPSGSPATALAVLGDICTQAGLTLDYGGADVAIEGDLTGHTCREMVGYIAALLGCNAVISREGALKLIWYTDNGQSITPDDYYSGGLSLTGESVLAGVRMTKTVTVRTTGTDGTITETDQTTNYDAGSGTGTVIAVDNPFATQDIVDAVWAKIGGLGTFRAGSCSAFGGLLTEPGDLISVTGLSGLTSILPAMTVQLELDGGCRCTITASGQSQTEADAQILGPTGKALKKIEADIARFKDLYADNAEIERAKIEKLIAGEITLNSVLHSTDYVRTGVYADSGMGIEFNTRRFATPNFAIDPSGNIYAKGGLIALFNLGRGSNVAYTGTPSAFLNTDGESGRYQYDAPYLTAGEDGTAIYNIPKTATSAGETYTIGKLWVQVFEGSPESESEDVDQRLAGRVIYLRHDGTTVHESDFSALVYHPDGSLLGNTFALNAEYLAQSVSVRLEVDLATGDTIDVQRQYGTWQALYYGSNRLMGDPNGAYFGTDGLSIGEDIALTPDGHATVGALTVQNNIGVAGHVTATGSLVAGLNVVISNDGSVYIRDVNNVARRMLTITSANAATVGHSALPLSVYGSGITLAGATTIRGNLSNTGSISAGSSVNATTGVAAGNGHGLYVKNASGSLVKLFWLTGGNVCTVGSNDYATSILGKTITASKTITVSSDRRLKRDITVLDGRHQALFDRLRPVSYRLREDEDGKEHIGLVAQEVQEALEQSGLTNSALVQADSEGMLSIGYGELIGLLVDEVQTLKARVKALEERGEI